MKEEKKSSTDYYMKIWKILKYLLSLYSKLALL